MYVHGSIPALDALRGAAFNPDPQVPVDCEAVRLFYTTPVYARRLDHGIAPQRSAIRARPAGGRRHRPAGRGHAVRLVPLRSSAHGLAVSVYAGDWRRGRRPASSPGWSGREIVAFRLHLPSKIDYHNAGASNLRPGNILVWEQKLTDRMNGVPLLIDARMQTQSILYTTLSLFGITCVAVALMFGIVIVVVRRSGKELGPEVPEIHEPSGPLGSLGPSRIECRM